MPDRVVHLAEERARTDASWRGNQDSHVPLSLAASFAFHALREPSDQTVSRLGYRGDLNLMAVALSRLCSIYTRLTAEDGPTLLAVDPRTQRFANGANELHCNDGFFFDRLSILRADVGPAVEIMKRAGLSLSCQEYPVTRNRHQHASE